MPGQPTRPNPAPRPRLGLALGSGAARGWAHIGVLRALEQAGIVPDIICGTSIGALVGGIHLAGHLDPLETWACELSRMRLVRLLDPRLSGGGLIGGDRLMGLIHANIGDIRIEDLAVSFAAVATDLGTGHEMWFQDGPLIDAMRASFALPGLFPPVWLGRQWLADGALVNPVPVSVCRAMGAQMVIAVNLNADIAGGFRRPASEEVPSDAGPDAAESLCAFAQPGAPTVTAVYESFRGEILGDLGAAQPVDMVLLSLHGAMMAHGYDDCEGDLIERVRRLVGPRVPIGVELDLHCHITAKMLAGATAIVTFKEYPHVDADARAREVFTICESARHGGGAPSDATFVIERVVERRMRDVVSCAHWDPVAVRLCMEAGEGARFRLRLGGKCGAVSGAPLDLDVTVERIAADATQSFASGTARMGDAVWVSAAGVDIVLNSIRTQTFHPDAMSNLGLDPRARKIVIVKSAQHFYAGFAPIAREILYVAAPPPPPRRRGARLR